MCVVSAVWVRFCFQIIRVGGFVSFLFCWCRGFFTHNEEIVRSRCGGGELCWCRGFFTHNEDIVRSRCGGGVPCFTF